jgi:hypothetical protein
MLAFDWDDNPVIAYFQRFRSVFNVIVDFVPNLVREQKKYKINGVRP